MFQPFFWKDKDDKMIFDTHTHIIIFEGLRDQAEELVEKAKELGVNWMAVVGFWWRN